MAADPAALYPLQRVRLVDQVTNRLRDMIISGELSPGLPLLQIQLSEQFGVSRTPLREAFRILERDGLVRVTNGNQTVEVIEMTPAEIIDLYQIRESLDGLAARLLATSGLSSEVEAHLIRSLATMSEVMSAERLQIAAYDQAHIEFHLGIMRANPNRRLQELQHIVRLSSQMFLPRYMNRTSGDESESFNEDCLRSLLIAGNDDHRQIFESIKGGDAAKAETVAKRHIRKWISEISRVTNRPV
ncbi:GntR family transcriptional regulator [Blastococcus sp. URHD0036]|uniref:GntR family transcriptional regulator n=1 Tax=Blastococcus sp. URHD0036 TaxID=1380356 RepID=UPI0004959B24|nr:GntR family transcriptional regulator [Blastococcus sp. URHD0036]